jgi:histidinol phosphatase-like enzyme
MELLRKLESRKVPYAVVCSTELTRGVFDWHTQDWFVVISKANFDKVKELKFIKTSSHKKIAERSLSKHEIKMFRQIADKYNIAISNKHGRVYELKETNFKNTLL